MEDWPLFDRQEYIVDLEMNVTRIVAALVVASGCGKTEKKHWQSWNPRPTNPESWHWS